MRHCTRDRAGCDTAGADRVRRRPPCRVDPDRTAVRLPRRQRQQVLGARPRRGWLCDLVGDLLRRRPSVPGSRGSLGHAAGCRGVRSGPRCRSSGGSPRRRGWARRRPGGGVCSLHRDEGAVRLCRLCRGRTHVPDETRDEARALTTFQSRSPGANGGPSCSHRALWHRLRGYVWRSSRATVLFTIHACMPTCRTLLKPSSSKSSTVALKQESVLCLATDRHLRDRLYSPTSCLRNLTESTLESHSRDSLMSVSFVYENTCDAPSCERRWLLLL